MTQGPRIAPPTPLHPDPGRIAAHAERRLPAVEASRLDEHLATCPECYDTFAETVRFALDEEAQELPERRAPEVAFFQRPAFRVAAALAVATFGLFMAQNLWMRRAIEELRQRQAGRVGLVAELVEAMGTTRFVEPRLTGGFQHGRLVVLRAGDRPQGLDAHSPAVLTAVAHIREKAQGDSSPTALGALAVTYLVSGDVDKAVRALESATAQDPKNPRLQSDLAAAYLVRATRLDEPADLPRALEAAETAIESKDAPAEAWFNRALVLEHLHLVDSAKKAWQEYLQHDSTSEWADEARKRIEELPPARKSTLEEDRARARAAAAEGQAAIDRLADEAPAVLSDYFLAELLPAWADAQLTGHPSASALRTRAQQIGDALLRATGDALPRDAALALVQPSSPGRDPPRLQALGYKALHEAQRLYELQRSACSDFRQASRLLQQGGSPFHVRASAYGTYTCHVADPEAALSALGHLESLAQDHGYAGLLGLVRRLQGLFLLARGRLTAALEKYRLARASFEQVRDLQSESWALALSAEVFTMAGEEREAWQARRQALTLLGQVGDPQRRHGILEEAALACVDARLPRSALAFQSAVVQAATAWSNAAAMSDALVWRAWMLRRVHPDSAIPDLEEARRWTARIDDRSFADRQAAQIDAVEGEVLVDAEPERAIPALERSLAYFEPASPFRTPRLHWLLGRAQAAHGLDDDAESQFEKGIRVLEGQRSSQQDADLQAAFFDQGAPLFDAMVDLQLDRRRDPERALAVLERSRARQLAEALTTARRDRPLGVEELKTALPDGVALLYYSLRPDRVLAWALTRERAHGVELPLTADAVEREVAAYAAALQSRADPPEVRRHAARLYDDLVRSLVTALPPQSALIVVPDGVLHAVAFAGLLDRETGRYLVEDHLVGLAPSGTVFVRASAAAAANARRSAGSALVLGDPRIGRGSSRLRGAAAEADEVARLYPNAQLLTGPEATKAEFLDRLAASAVVHFAGHAISGDDSRKARLLLASAGAEDDGALYLRELDDRRLRHTRLVVLAACATATGPLSQLEGSLSLARPFLAAGVPGVVASLWDLDDAISRSLFVAFHRSLVRGAEPLAALRATQIALIRDGDPALAHPASWAGIVYLGGLAGRTGHDL